MHSDTHFLVTQFCNPETLSNAHGLLGCILQCNVGKNNKIPHVRKEIARFLFDTAPSCASLEYSDEARPIFTDQTEKNHITIIDFQAHLVSQSLSGSNTTSKVASTESLLFEHFFKRQKVCRTPKLKSNIQDKHRNSNKRFALRKSSTL